MQSIGSERPARVGVSPSFRELRRAREAQEKRWQVEGGRRGILGAWLNLTAPPPASSLASLSERERLRKAELSAYVLFGVLLTGIALIPNGLVNTPTLFSAAIIIASAILAGVLNRANRTATAAVVLISAFSVSLLGAMGTTPRLDLMWMPALDFFAVPVLLAGLLLSRRAPFVVAGMGAIAVALLLELKPRDAWLGTMVAQLGIYHFMVRPIALMAIVAIASWLWSRSVEQAIIRADRAEEVAVMEHQLAEQKHQLDRGIQSLLETHVRVANGDFSARAATSQDNVLWQIAVSLNNLLARLDKYATIEQRLQHTEQEIDRLVGAMENARAGHGAKWPAASGTRVDRLLIVLTGGAHQPVAGQTPSTPTAQVPGFAAGQQATPGFVAAGPTHAMPTGGGWSFATPPREMPVMPPITGKWREVSAQRPSPGPFAPAGRGHVPPAGGFSGHPGRSTRAADLSPNGPRSHDAFAWSFPPAGTRPPHDPLFDHDDRPTHRPSNGHSTPQPTHSGSAHWDMEPLPPLPPTPPMPSQPDGTAAASQGPRADRADATQSWPAQSASGPHGDPFPSNPGESSPDESNAGEAQPIERSEAPAASGTGQGEWPDWPTYLKSLVNQSE